MKSLIPVLLLFVWISVCIPSSTAQTGDLPLLPPADMAKESAEVKGPTIDSLNDKVRLERGDRLSYRISEERLPAVMLVVNDAGDIDVPLIGHIRAIGKTCRQLAEEIKPLLEKEFYYRATVIIGLETHSERSIGKIYVMGQVRLAGGLEIPAGEVLTLSKAIARAQGFADYADRENVRIIRRNDYGKAETAVYNVAEIVEKGLIDKDPLIYPNDTIVVPEIKRFHTKIYVLGRVNNPCSIDLQENEEINVSKAIARAQGFAEYADKERVRLLRKTAIVPWFTADDFADAFSLASKILTPPDPIFKHIKEICEPEYLDVLATPKITPRERNIALIGQLNKIINGDRLYDERLFADIKLSTDTRRLIALNPKGDDLIRLNRYLLEDYCRAEIRHNRPPEYQTFIVNVAEIIEKGLMEKDPIVLPNDIVVVLDSKRTNSKVSVMGMVRYPQAIEMLPGGNLTVSQAIAKAGGFVEFANKRKVKLMRRTPPMAYLFVESDFRDPRKIAKQLRECKEPATDYIWEHLNTRTQRAIVDPKSSKAELASLLCKDFNHILQDGAMYTQDRFCAIKLPPEIQSAVNNHEATILFSEGDFLDIGAFTTKLTRHNDPFFTFLWRQFTPEEQRILGNAVVSTRPTDSIVLDMLLLRLNTILRGGLIYNPECFQKIEISPEVLYLLAQAPQGDDLIRLNRELVEDACPLDIRRARFNPRDKTLIQTNRRLFELVFQRDLRRHDEYQSIIVDMQRIIDKAELDKDPLIEPDDLIMVPESWINF